MVNLPEELLFMERAVPAWQSSPWQRLVTEFILFSALKV